MIDIDQCSKQVFGGKISRILFEIEDAANVGQEFDSHAVIREPKASDDSSTSSFRPRTADAIGNVQKRLGAILLSRCHAGRKASRSLTGDLGECGGVGGGP